MPTTRDQHRVRVAEAVRLRRADLELTQDQLAEDAGVALRTVQNVEAGLTTIRISKRARFERALHWPRGTLTKAYDYGTSPNGVHSDSTVELYAPTLAEILYDPNISDDLRRRILAALERLHEEFARDCARLYRLRTKDRTIGSVA